MEIASAMLNSAGIAYRLLADFAKLNPGDFLIQNDASSPVGMAVIQLCKKRGIKTINIVKDWYVVCDRVLVKYSFIHNTLIH